MTRESRPDNLDPPPASLPAVSGGTLAALMPGLVVALYRVLRWLLQARSDKQREPTNQTRWK